ncbi:hypothetical protein [Nonomuraea cypriaca]|nr:hypothetical protein [Nonomuraea cypriaca]
MIVLAQFKAATDRATAITETPVNRATEGTPIAAALVKVAIEGAA